MDPDGGLAERERQDAERQADHEVRRTRLATGSAPQVETETEEEPKPKRQTRSRARAKAKKS